MLRPRILCGLGLLLVLLPAVALGQGSFVPAQTWWTGPGSTTGIATDTMVQNYLIDADGNGTLDPGEPTHPIPQIVKNSLVFFDQRLSPSRDFVYIFGSDPNCLGLRVYFYRIPATDGAPLELRITECIAPSIAQIRFFDVPTNPDVEYAVIATTSDGFEQRMFWMELFSGMSGYTNNINFSPNVADITFEPSGIAAFVQHDTSDGDNLANYTVVELCPDDFATGGPAGGVLTQVAAPILTAESVSDGMGGLDILVSQTGTPITQFALDTCTGPPVVVGAACFTDGSCADGLTEAAAIAAGGTWQGAGSLCNGTCPPAQIVVPTLSASGPSTSPVLSPVTYTINYGNTGTIAMTNAIVSAVLPNGLDFVSVGSGGTYNSFIRRFEWNVGTVAPGTGGSVTFSAEAPCGTTSATLLSYFVSSDQSANLTGTPPVTTTFLPSSGAPLTVTANAVADAGAPALNGDLITKTITLQNTDTVVAQGVTFTVNLGSAVDFEQIVQTGGGNISTTAFSLTWTGDVGAMSTSTIEYQVRVKECRQAYLTEVNINNGFAFTLRDTCNQPVGTGTPGAPVPLGPPPLTVGLAATNIFVYTPPPGAFWPTVGLLRAGGEVEYAFTITNNYSTPLAGVVATATMPTSLVPVGDPPFVGMVPAGTTWDNVTQQVQWSGTLAPLQTVTITFRGTYPLTETECPVFFSATADYGSCPNAVSASAPRLWPVDSPSAAGEIVEITPFSGLFRHTVDTATLDPYVCSSFEINTGIDITDDEDIWVAGTPTYRLDPVDLELEIFEFTVFQAIGASAPEDVVVAPDGTIYFCGSANGLGAILRMDAVTRAVSVLYQAPAGTGALHRIVMDGDGFLAASSFGGVVRVDPNNPTNSTLFNDPVITNGYWSLALDTDGNYLVSDFTFGLGARALVSIDRLTGAHAVEIANLNTIVPSSQPFMGMEVDPRGDVYFAPQSGTLLKLNRSAGTGMFITGAFGAHADLAFRGTLTTAVGGTPEVVLPTHFELLPNVPNPFNPATEIRFALPQSGPVRLDLFDLRGRRVRSLLDRVVTAGHHSIRWNGRDDMGSAVASGVYVVRILAEGEEKIQKIVLTK